MLIKLLVLCELIKFLEFQGLGKYYFYSVWNFGVGCLEIMVFACDDMRVCIEDGVRLMVQFSINSVGLLYGQEIFYRCILQIIVVFSVLLESYMCVW